MFNNRKARRKGLLKKDVEKRIAKNQRRISQLAEQNFILRQVLIELDAKEPKAEAAPVAQAEAVPESTPAAIQAAIGAPTMDQPVPPVYPSPEVPSVPDAVLPATTLDAGAAQ